MNDYGILLEDELRSLLRANPGDHGLEDRLVTLQATRYNSEKERLKGSGSLDRIAFDRFTMELDSAEPGSLYTVVCHNTGMLEPFETSIFSELICRNPDCNVIDVGANYGIYTLIAGDFSRHNIVNKIVSVEPDRRVFSKLFRSVMNNNFKSRCTLFNKAISDSDGEQVSIFINGSGSVDNRTFVDGGIRNISESYPVETITVDSIYRELAATGGAGGPLIVKIDIQGNEPRAVKGMKKTLAEAGSIALLCEFMPEMMESAGFDPYLFGRELFSLGFSAIYNINQTARLLEQISPEDLAAITTRCRSIKTADERRYTNLLCCRNVAVPSIARHKSVQP